ncbi:putative type VI secretion system effector [Burkholderia sp. MSMB1498]|uniref:putative type VI secretion system effector n=1 Tax=Burkholderia sp. MSMB1498 TaxID=1637842 RepID=UPI000A604461|nr:putative type VI secretion system effector [Burkholderia sp. MSMB1498]
MVKGVRERNMDIDRAVVLKGRLKNFKKNRVAVDFLLSDMDRSAAELTAVASALAGSGGAIGLASLAGTKEEADKVQFELGGKFFTGWLMWSPFQDDEEVEVVAEPLKDGTYRAFAILRPSDHTIALYPHCSRGKSAHFKNSFKWFMRGFLIVFLIYFFVMLATFWGEGIWREFFIALIGGGLGEFFVYGVIAYSMARRFLPFADMAEQIFHVLGRRDAAKIDLPARSKMARKKEGKPGLGVLYFRY